ncbi:hypothetical protein, partial [Clostridioides difficile]|uniref:hypothetical protein n=1 Tax=Clostridioides difficile TaxID=1496 RepID=UPI001A9A6699
MSNRYGKYLTISMTVSYKNLRANESILDIVCRIQSEKKKRERHKTSKAEKRQKEKSNNKTKDI